jgi:hypothetical protein
MQLLYLLTKLLFGEGFPLGGGGCHAHNHNSRLNKLKAVKQCCGSGMLITDHGSKFSTLDPESRVKRSRIRIRIKFLTQKTVPKLTQKLSGMFIPDLGFGSRIQRTTKSTGSQIQIRIRYTAVKNRNREDSTPESETLAIKNAIMKMHAEPINF